MTTLDAVWEAVTSRAKTGCGNLYVTLNTDAEGKPVRILLTLGKAGGCPACTLEAVARLASVGFEYGLPVEQVIRQLKGLSCDRPSPVVGGPQSCLSFVGYELEKLWEKCKAERSG